MRPARKRGGATRRATTPPFAGRTYYLPDHQGSPPPDDPQAPPAAEPEGARWCPCTPDLRTRLLDAALRALHDDGRPVLVAERSSPFTDSHVTFASERRAPSWRGSACSSRAARADDYSRNGHRRAGAMILARRARRWPGWAGRQRDSQQDHDAIAQRDRFIRRSPLTSDDQDLSWQPPATQEPCLSISRKTFPLFAALLPRCSFSPPPPTRRRATPRRTPPAT